MSKDLEIIKKLEKKIGEKIKPLNLLYIMSHFLHTYGYAIDKNENIIGLNLGNNHISDISSLKDLKNLNHLYLYNNHISDILERKYITYFWEKSN